MDYKRLVDALKKSTDLGLFKKPKKSVLFYFNQNVYLIFESNTPESEPQEPIEGWRIIKDIPNPEGDGPSIIICQQPPIIGSL